VTLDARTLEQIREHIPARPPLVPLFHIAVLEAGAEPGSVDLGYGGHATRYGGSIAGPDVAIYALISASCQDAAAVTVDPTIDFLRPATAMPRIASTVPPRAGRRLFTAEVRSTTQATTKLVVRATGTYALSVSGRILK
jgi:acyl-coenzyme A thioesterase PaaI-like protein